MSTHVSPHYSIFNQATCIASGELAQIAPLALQALAVDPHAQLLAFADDTGIQSDFNWADVAANPPQSPATSADDVDEPEPVRKAGRPKLGVVAREVTLLPRHWDWLAQQSGGASVALRKLVEEARRGSESKDRKRTASERTYRVMNALAGNETGFEEALRALYAGNQALFTTLISTWPVDIQTYVQRLSANAFATAEQIE